MVTFYKRPAPSAAQPTTISDATYCRSGPDGKWGNRTRCAMMRARGELDDARPPYASHSALKRAIAADVSASNLRWGLGMEKFLVFHNPALSASHQLSPRHLCETLRYIVLNLLNQHIKRFDGVVGYHVRLTSCDTRERSRVRASVES